MIICLVALIIFRTGAVAIDIHRRQNEVSVPYYAGLMIGQFIWAFASVVAIGWVLLPAYGLGPHL